MKTKILILTVLVATSITLLFATGKSENNRSYSDCKAQIIKSLQHNLTLSKEMDETTANVFIKINENGEVLDIRVFYPDKEISQEIKKVIETENFNLKQDVAGIYKLKVKFSVR